MKDNCFRLFGRNIQATRVCNDEDYECISSSDNNSSKQDENRAQYEISSSQEAKNQSDSTVTSDTKIDFKSKSNSSQDTHNNHNNNQYVVSDETSSTKSSDNKSSTKDQKPLKKPNKILPCPRCNSMVTKFCYFNNNNINQPRHFCKACQRYWTAGGTMRNVPVGAGRRKNKNSSSTSMYNNGGDDGQHFTWNPIAWQSGFPTMSFYSNSTNSSNNSRKNPRDVSTMLYFGTFDNSGRVVRPKTMMTLEDPIEAANSSLWSTLKMKNNEHAITKTGFLGVTTTQGEYYNGNEVKEMRSSSNSNNMNNPAAYSRALMFHEIV